MNTTHHRFARALLAAAAGLALAAPALAQMGSEGGSGSASAKGKAEPARPAKAPQTAVAVTPRGNGVSSSTSIAVNDNGREIKLEMKDGVVTHAEVDGKTIPDDRIDNDGDTVRLKDESGEVIYEYNVAGSPLVSTWTGIDPSDPTWTALSQLRPHVYSLRGSGSATLFGPHSAAVLAEPEETPSVMMGVQLGAPDSTLAGHLGIDRRKATLLTAVHEGLPAAGAGLEPYDVIVSVNGKDDAAPSDIRAALKDKKPGESIGLGVLHKGVRRDVTVSLEGYDRKKLAESKVRRIDADGENDVVAIAAAPEAPLPPLPPGLPEEYKKQIEQYLKDNAGRGAPRAFRFRSQGAAPDTQKLLADIERQQADASRRADEAARRAEELANRLRERVHAGTPAAPAVPGTPGAPGAMEDRLDRLEKMLERLMDEKSKGQKPEQPGKDASGRS